MTPTEVNAMVDHTDDLTTCSLSYAFSAISGKWKPFIIWYLNAAEDNTCRYGELKRRVPWKISHKIFTQQLRELELAKIIVRREYDERPMRVEYSLTDQGRLLAPVILYLRDWGAVFNEKFDAEDLLQRTQGRREGDLLRYGFASESLGKSVRLDFKF